MGSRTTRRRTARARRKYMSWRTSYWSSKVLWRLSRRNEPEPAKPCEPIQAYLLCMRFEMRGLVGIITVIMPALVRILEALSRFSFKAFPLALLSQHAHG